MSAFCGDMDGRDLAFAIVTARFNELVTDRLQSGAIEALCRCGTPADKVDVVRVPGAFEIPVTARRLAASGRYHAVICLGAVIRGETPHFDHVAGEAAKGISRASLDTGVPVIFGVLTTENTDQALARAGGKSGNKGAEAALAAVEMARLFQKLPK